MKTILLSILLGSCMLPTLQAQDNYVSKVWVADQGDGTYKNPVLYADNVSACSLCLSCSNVCPVKVDLGEQIYRWRQDLDKLGRANREKKLMSAGMKVLMERPALFNTALKFAPLVNKMPRSFIYNRLNAWGEGRELPTFAKESFNEMWKNNKIKK